MTSQLAPHPNPLPTSTWGEGTRGRSGGAAARRALALALGLDRVEEAVGGVEQLGGGRVWLGIVQSSHAGAKGGLGALGLAKKARASLESALALDPKALDGSAYTSLGTLYYKVPGFPLGFGNKDKAQEFLRNVLAANRDSPYNRFKRNDARRETVVGNDGRRR